jgi:hypothetical protein
MTTRDDYRLFDTLSSRSKCSVLAWLFIYAATHPDEITPEARRRLFNPSHRMTRHMPDL